MLNTVELERLLDWSDTVELEGALECQIQLSWREHWSVKYS